MTGRGTCAGVSFVGVLIVTAVSGSTRAAADAPAAYGWWASPLAGALDVPEGGLLVAGSQDSPTSYAAVDVEATAGARVAITLRVAPSSATLPTSAVQACPLTTPSFEPADGGDLGDAPPYDCVAAVPGVAAPDGTTVAFDLGVATREGGIAVAIVPATGVTRMVFDRPGDDSVQLTAPSPTPAQPVGDPTPSATSPTTTRSSSTLPRQPATSTPVPVPEPAAAPSAAPPAVVPGNGFLPVSSAGTSARGLAGSALLLAAVGGLWWASKRPTAGHAEPRTS